MAGGKLFLFGGFFNSKVQITTQVEVYDPSPLQARALVLGGSIKPIR